MTISQKFKKLAEDLLSEAAAIDCSKQEYYDGLCLIRDEIEDSAAEAEQELAEEEGEFEDEEGESEDEDEESEGVED